MTPRLPTGQAAKGFSWPRVSALAAKDARELLRNPGAVIPAVMMVFASLLPLFLVIFLVPAVMGQTLEQSGEFTEAALNRFEHHIPFACPASCGTSCVNAASRSSASPVTRVMRQSGSTVAPSDS